MESSRPEEDTDTPYAQIGLWTPDRPAIITKNNE